MPLINEAKTLQSWKMKWASKVWNFGMTLFLKKERSLKWHNINGLVSLFIYLFIYFFWLQLDPWDPATALKPRRFNRSLHGPLYFLCKTSFGFKEPSQEMVLVNCVRPYSPVWISKPSRGEIRNILPPKYKTPKLDSQKKKKKKRRPLHKI